MAYNGYGYAHYQHTDARTQNQTPYAPSSQPSKPADGSLQNDHQNYGQRHGGWGGRSVPGAQTSNQQNIRNSYWIPPASNTPSQSTAYQQQVSYRMSDTEQATSSTRRYNSQPQPQHRTGTHSMSGYKAEATSTISARQSMATSGTHYTTNSPQEQTGVTAASHNYRSNTPSHQPDYMQSSRTVAATAMTALSSASRHTYNYIQNTPATPSNTNQISNPSQYNISTSGTTRSQLGANTVNSQNTFYQRQTSDSGQSLDVRGTASNILRQTSKASDISPPSVTSSAEPSPQLQSRAHQMQPTTSRSPSLLHTNRAGSGPQILPAAQRYSVGDVASDDAQPSPTLDQNTFSQPTATTSTEAVAAPQSSLPRFVDPTSVYNPYPYYRQLRASGVAITTQSTVEQSLTSATSGSDALQTVAQEDSTQSPAPDAPEPETDTMISTTNTPDVPMAKEPRKGAPKDALKNSPKKVRKTASQKQKSKAESTPKPRTAEPQTNLITHTQTNEKEDTASQMQKMLDEMRMKDPELFKSILAANMSKPENREQDIQHTPTNDTRAAPVKVLSSVTATTTLAEPSPPRILNNSTPSRKTHSKHTPGKAIFLISTPAQMGVAPSAKNHVLIENPEVEQRLPETAPVAVNPSTPDDGDIHSRRQITKTGLIDGLPDLGKFPALRRRKKPKASLPAGGPCQDFNTTLHLDDERNAPDQTSQPVPCPQIATSIPQQYASLNIEEQRLRLLETFNKTGHAELPNTSNIPLSTTNIVQPSQINNASDTLTAPSPPPQHPVEEGKDKEDRTASIWPEHKRRVLAESACEYIATFPGNGSITPDFVSSLIDQNPSYVQLCNMLEGHGYTINKVHFAKHLLQAFPDLGESSGKTTQAMPQSTVQAPQPNVLVSSFVSPTPPPATLAQSSPKGVMPQIGTPPVQSGSALPLSREEQRQKSLNLLHLSRCRKTASQRHNSISTSPAPQSREPLPNSKEAMARKRTFAEIIDLSQALSDEESEDEEAGQSHQVETVSEEPMDMSLDGPVEIPNTTIPIQPPALESLAQSPPTGHDITQTAQTQSVRSREPPLVAQPSPTEPIRITKSKHSVTSHLNGTKESLRRYNGIVKPMDKAKALKRSYYDPRTIARDILIAAGRHPTERPLNQHLLKLKEKFQYIDYSSDLETFRWDLVDPGGPPPPKIAPEPLITRPKFNPRDNLQSSRDGASSTRLASFNLAPSQVENSQTVSADSFSWPMAPTQARSSFASPLPTRLGPRRTGRSPSAKNKPKPVASLAKNVEIVIPTVTSQKPSNKYQIYECRFDDCGAKLHNFEIFRKHVLKLHGRPEQDQAVCMWAGCASLVQSGQTEQRTFSPESLREHLDSVHLSPLAWKLGDGPKSVSSGETGKFHLPIFIS
ncbi:hypothetical protein MferCBS31731_006755 [Microsporum ferrugineum]